MGKQPTSATKVFLGWGLVVLFLFILDQAAKYLAPEVFKNFYFAFSLPMPKILMYVIYFAALLLLGYLGKKNFKNFSFIQRLAWVLLAAGALLNVGERLIFGYVRDIIYIQISSWVGIYNLADGYILLGLMIFLFSKNQKHDF